LRGSQVTLSEQDENLNYTWVYNPITAQPEQILGRSDADLLPNDTIGVLTEAKRRVLETGVAERLELPVARPEGLVWFDLRIERLDEAGGSGGVVSTATDITRLKRQEEHLRLVMRELNHRSKNLLTIVLSLARQTASSFAVPAAFTARLQERLSVLAAAHDVLARADWQGADIKAVIQEQLQHHLDAFGDRIRMRGGACVLTPEASHYIGMAIHELGSNAVKHGALADGAGTVDIRWRTRRRAGASTLTMTWIEHGGRRDARPECLSFGGLILTRLTPQALGGEASLEFAADGLRWTLVAPFPVSDAAVEGVQAASLSPQAYA
jgi:two-component sensor histidine kinase